ncbi:glycoside hydrolase family 85 protein [Tilletiaria anomala UBC 951]|uniref:Glycoside hydrolase family 85 protein n=1 Tax=Tilletiaria anomala (strain ATCC 24038 / CBS 436.72 / UBC 951) TaxID=1037660 RepID=A0A066WH12_TILAU|nr:glycoside hydrolase family 85 protein [Tilletiaria anomala UBC 951]KDN53282.1 glycoside hydrolase family 85 protein [Tilletiaria anomala UBC 951]
MPASLDLDAGPGDLDCLSAPLRPDVDPDMLPEPSYFTELQLLDCWADLRQQTAGATGASAISQDVAHPILNDKRGQFGLLDVEDMNELCDSSLKVGHEEGAEDDFRPKLMVCHDHKGGYKEQPDAQCYTFEHWQLADYFVYFSHHRVTVPPPAWIEAAHRHGTKILGTLIFEWKESIAELSLLLRGPECEHIPLLGPSCINHRSVANDTAAAALLFSPHFADVLITLALQRGFDGYLINVEVPLDLGFQCSGEPWPWWVRSRVRHIEMQKNATRLRAWVAYLRFEGRRRVGIANARKSERAAGRNRRRESWHVAWYDSVTIDGELAWQDALTPANQAFFEVADSIFTNYTWVRPPEALPPGQFPQSVHSYTGAPQDGGFHPALVASARLAEQMRRARSDVFVGIDVFGRNCCGGMDCWKSLEMIMPHRTRERDEAPPAGLSVALFAPGWTWEHDEPADQPGHRSWEDWWNEDQQFWRQRQRQRKEQTPGDAFALSRYFPPRVWELDYHFFLIGAQSFYTNFAMGSGCKWFVRGACVRDWSEERLDATVSGWTDVAASMPQPHWLLQDPVSSTSAPSPQVAGPDSRGLDMETTTSDAWSGNTCIRVRVRLSKSRSGVNGRAGVFIPFFRLRLTEATPAGLADHVEGLMVQITAVIKKQDSAASSAWTVRPHLRAAGASEVHEAGPAGAQPDAARVASLGWRGTEAWFRWPQTAEEAELGVLVARDHELLQEREEDEAATVNFFVGALCLRSKAAAERQQKEAVISVQTAAAAPVQEARDSGTVSISSAASSSSNRGFAILEWADFAPDAPFYELFTRRSPEAGGAREDQEQWLCTATREYGRTEVVLSSERTAGREVVVRSLF